MDSGIRRPAKSDEESNQPDVVLLRVGKKAAHKAKVKPKAKSQKLKAKSSKP